MKELVLKKRLELEEICRKTHLVLEADSGLDCAIEAIENGISINESFVYLDKHHQICVFKAICVAFPLQAPLTLLTSLNKWSFRLERLKKRLLVERKYSKGLRNGSLRATRSVGLRSTIGLVLFRISWV